MHHALVTGANLNRLRELGAPLHLVPTPLWRDGHRSHLSPSCAAGRSTEYDPTRPVPYWWYIMCDPMCECGGDYARVCDLYASLWSMSVISAVLDDLALARQLLKRPLLTRAGRERAAAALLGAAVRLWDPRTGEAISWQEPGPAFRAWFESMRPAWLQQVADLSTTLVARSRAHRPDEGELRVRSVRVAPLNRALPVGSDDAAARLPILKSGILAWDQENEAVVVVVDVDPFVTPRLLMDAPHSIDLGPLETFDGPQTWAALRRLLDLGMSATEALTAARGITV